MLKSLISRFVKDERGVTAIEYGVIGVAIAVVVGIAMTGAGGDDGLTAAISAAFEGMTSAMTSVSSGNL